MYYSLRVLLDHVLRNEQSGCVSSSLAHSSRVCVCWHVHAFLSPRLSGILDVFVFSLAAYSPLVVSSISSSCPACFLLVLFYLVVVVVVRTRVFLLVSCANQIQT